MTHIQTKSRESEKGFTLVELAIVMIIIGLLIGGVLKGQELITNAQISSTVSSVQGIDTAMGSFRDAFNAYPGDMVQADMQARIPGCAGCSGGNGNNRVGDATTLGDDPGAGADTEPGEFWQNLVNANFVSDSVRELSIGGTYSVGYHTSGNIPFVSGAGQAAASPGHYLIVANLANAQEDVLSATNAARLDRKLDDGRAVTGGAQAAGTCLTSITTVGTNVGDDVDGDGVCDTADGDTCITTNSYDEAGDTATGLCRLVLPTSF